LEIRGLQTLHITEPSNEYFGIPSPKDDIDGSEVAKVFYEENDIDRIARYCEKDVLATAQLFLRFKGEELIDPEKVERA